jgi:hypothetical protein
MEGTLPTNISLFFTMGIVFMANLVFKDFTGWRNGRDFPHVTLTRVSWDSAPGRAVAFVFFGHVNLDFDGSPTAYGPFRVNPDDGLGNAGNATQGWFGVASAAESNPFVKSKQIEIDRHAPGFHPGGVLSAPVEFPVVQQAKFGDPKPGFYVSTTSQHGSIAGVRQYRQNTYIDASKVAYGALDRFLQSKCGFQLGDFGLAVRHDQNRQSGFSFADMGGWNHALGECSHRVGLDLGVSKRSPGHWDNNFPVSFIIFPNTAATSSGTDDTVIKARLSSCLRNLATADNAHELPVLMAANERSPVGIAKGKAGLDALRKIKGARPSNVGTVNLGLATFGFLNAAAAPTSFMQLLQNSFLQSSL